MKKVSREDFVKKMTDLYDNAKMQGAGIVNIFFMIDENLQGTTLKYENFDLDNERDSEGMPLSLK